MHPGKYLCLQRDAVGTALEWGLGNQGGGETFYIVWIWGISWGGRGGFCLYLEISILYAAEGKRHRKQLEGYVRYRTYRIQDQSLLDRMVRKSLVRVHYPIL